MIQQPTTTYYVCEDPSIHQQSVGTTTYSNEAQNGNVTYIVVQPPPQYIFIQQPSYPQFMALPTSTTKAEPTLSLPLGVNGQGKFTTELPTCGPFGPLPPPLIPVDASFLKCYFCDGDGHKAIHCPKNPKWCGETSGLCNVHGKVRCMSALQPQADNPKLYECTNKARCRNAPALPK
jgi:hypothetical protein